MRILDYTFRQGVLDEKVMDRVLWLASDEDVEEVLDLIDSQLESDKGLEETVAYGHLYLKCVSPFYMDPECKESFSSKYRLVSRLDNLLRYDE